MSSVSYFRTESRRSFYKIKSSKMIVDNRSQTVQVRDLFALKSSTNYLEVSLLLSEDEVDFFTLFEETASDQEEIEQNSFIFCKESPQFFPVPWIYKNIKLPNLTFEMGCEKVNKSQFFDDELDFLEAGLDIYNYRIFKMRIWKSDNSANPQLSHGIQIVYKNMYNNKLFFTKVRHPDLKRTTSFKEVTIDDNNYLKIINARRILYYDEMRIAEVSPKCKRVENLFQSYSDHAIFSLSGYIGSMSIERLFIKQIKIKDWKYIKYRKYILTCKLIEQNSITIDKCKNDCERAYVLLSSMSNIYYRLIFSLV